MRAAFFKQPFKPVQSEARLVEYTVLDIEPTSPRGAGGDYQDQKKGGKSDVTAGKRVNGAMIEVVLSADFGVNDNTHTAFSQLVSTITCQVNDRPARLCNLTCEGFLQGHILQPGDLVMGYDLGAQLACFCFASSSLHLQSMYTNRPPGPLVDGVMAFQGRQTSLWTTS